MKVGDLVEYIPLVDNGLGRVGLVLSESEYGTHQVLCLWNIPDTASKKIQWWTPIEHLHVKVAA